MTLVLSVSCMHHAERLRGCQSDPGACVPYLSQVASLPFSGQGFSTGLFCAPFLRLLLDARHLQNECRVDNR